MTCSHVCANIVIFIYTHICGSTYALLLPIVQLRCINVEAKITCRDSTFNVKGYAISLTNSDLNSERVFYPATRLFYCSCTMISFSACW